MKNFRKFFPSFQKRLIAAVLSYLYVHWKISPKRKRSQTLNKNECFDRLRDKSSQASRRKRAEVHPADWHDSSFRRLQPGRNDFNRKFTTRFRDNCSWPWLPVMPWMDIAATGIQFARNFIGECSRSMIGNVSGDKLLPRNTQKSRRTKEGSFKRYERIKFALSILLQKGLWKILERLLTMKARLKEKTNHVVAIKS